MRTRFVPCLGGGMGRDRRCGLAGLPVSGGGTATAGKPDPGWRNPWHLLQSHGGYLQLVPSLIGQIAAEATHRQDTHIR